MNVHARETLFDYLTGATSAAEARAVEEHLARCSACREDLRMLREAIGISLVRCATTPVRSMTLIDVTTKELVVQRR